MQESRPSPHGVRFGVFEADLRASELRKHGLKVKLHGRPFQILALLLERPGEAITREELREKLWPADTFVDFDHGLNNAVNKLRDALGDSADNPRFVETLPRHGYRFIALVGKLDGAPAAVGPHPTPTQREASTMLRGRRGRLVVFALVAVVAMGAYFAWQRLWPQTAAPGEKIMLAVLPFENLSGDPEQDYLSDGLTEEMIAQLGRLSPQQLRVIARTSAMKYKDSAMGIDEIGRNLGVDFIVEGSVRQEGERVRITAKLIQVSDQTQLWSEDYNRDLSDILKLQSDVARAIAREVRLELPREAQTRLAGTRTVNPEAYQAYLKGRYYSNMAREWSSKKAVGYFEQAIEIDPNFALAYAALGRTAAYLNPTEKYMPKARAAALQALDLDSTLAEAHTALGRIQTYWVWDWVRAERFFQRGIELDPANAAAHQEYARYLTAMGRFDEAIAECKRALELDPVSRGIATALGRIFHRARRYDQAIEWYEKAVEIDPYYYYAHLFMGFTYEAKGMYEQAREKFERAVGLGGENSLAIPLVHGYAAGGYKGSRMASIRSQLPLVQEGKCRAHTLAMAYAGVGRTDEALDMLEKAYADRDTGMPFLRVEPVFDPIRSDPRFPSLLRRMNLLE